MSTLCWIGTLIGIFGMVYGMYCYSRWQAERKSTEYWFKKWLNLIEKEKS